MTGRLRSALGLFLKSVLRHTNVLRKFQAMECAKNFFPTAPRRILCRPVLRLPPTKFYYTPTLPCIVNFSGDALDCFSPGELMCPTFLLYRAELCRHYATSIGAFSAAGV